VRVKPDGVRRGSTAEICRSLREIQAGECYVEVRWFGRRATIEQAKGILMARQAIDANRAFAMSGKHSQHNGRKLADIAAAVVESHPVLLPPLRESTELSHDVDGRSRRPACRTRRSDRRADERDVVLKALTDGPPTPAVAARAAARTAATMRLTTASQWSSSHRSAATRNCRCAPFFAGAISYSVGAVVYA
jgi:ANTAR domain-containing protein